MARRRKPFIWLGGSIGSVRHGDLIRPGTVRNILAETGAAERRARREKVAVSGGSVSVRAHIRKGRPVRSYTRDEGARALMQSYRYMRKGGATASFARKFHKPLVVRVRHAREQAMGAYGAAARRIVFGIHGV